MRTVRPKAPGTKNVTVYVTVTIIQKLQADSPSHKPQSTNDFWILFEWAQQDSNLQPRDYEASALLENNTGFPIELGVCHEVAEKFGRE